MSTILSPFRGPSAAPGAEQTSAVALEPGSRAEHFLDNVAPPRTLDVERIPKRGALGEQDDDDDDDDASADEEVQARS